MCTKDAIPSFPDGLVAKNPSAKAVDTSSVSGPEDPTSVGQLSLLSHNYWAHVLQLLKPKHPTACAPQQEKPLQWEARVTQLESSSSLPRRERGHVQQWGHSEAKTIFFFKFLSPNEPVIALTRSTLRLAIGPGKILGTMSVSYWAHRWH